MSARHVAIVGAGLSGTLQAVHLARAGARVTLVERAHVPGRGVAYGTDRPEHLLNVPARRMSGLADDPDHFMRWWVARGGGEEDYAPRMVFGGYVRELLAGAGDAVGIVSGDAVDVAPEAQVMLADGRTIAADAVILAPGNLLPALPGRIETEALGEAWVGDPWAGDFATGRGAGDRIVLLGTGLTAVDVALTLDARGFSGHILALSRRGLAPRAHEPREPMVAPQEDLPETSVGLLRRVRRRSAEIGWRSAVHELRSVTRSLWRGATLEERRRFLRHLRPWWDVHRHRIAPAVGATIDRMQAERRLSFAAGKILGVRPDDDGAFLEWRPRGREAVEVVSATKVVNCTGPELDIVRAGEPLFDALIERGRIRPDVCRIGIDVDEELRAIGADGRPSENLFAIGPMTRGAFWESIAVPDIRGQAARIANRLTA